MVGILRDALGIPSRAVGGFRQRKRAATRRLSAILPCPARPMPGSRSTPMVNGTSLTRRRLRKTESRTKKAVPTTIRILRQMILRQRTRRNPKRVKRARRVRRARRARTNRLESRKGKRQTTLPKVKKDRRERNQRRKEKTATKIKWIVTRLSGLSRQKQTKRAKEKKVRRPKKKKWMPMSSRSCLRSVRSRSEREINTITCSKTRVKTAPSDCLEPASGLAPDHKSAESDRKADSGVR